ncbi:subtilase-type protease inhibitor [Streptomyces sp. NBC_00247]|uniref:SSI family serine proteinase inhibitor n=1 Tax=Streptomyces sp. NBC_00247 TaxID=2975689 RepID=UPI002E2E792B|nr:SSI family serine proteinase inhibitor [Streptomyces sp. NBC_00247]
MLRRLALTAVVSLAALSAAAPLATAVGPLPVPIEGSGPIPVSEQSGPAVQSGPAGSPYSGMLRPARKGAGPAEARGPRDTNAPALPGRGNRPGDTDEPTTLPAPVTLPAPTTGGTEGDTGAAADATTRLTVTVQDTGSTDSGKAGAAGGPVRDGSYELTCAPAAGTRSGTRGGGDHPEAQAACDRLAEAEGAGEDLFRPVDEDAMCTQMYGGPATARITGTWRGRPVDTTVNRKNGCEIARWNALSPLLPATGR